MQQKSLYIKKTTIKNILILLISIHFISCQSNTKTQTLKNEETYRVDADDKAMNAAIAQSKVTFDSFVNAFNHQLPNDEAHAIKVRFDTPEGEGEHIWINDLFIKNGVFYGVVNNTPVLATTIRLGDTIAVDINNMSDWMYLSNGVLKGGNTLRAIRNQLSEKEKQNLDQSIDFIIED